MSSKSRRLPLCGVNKRYLLGANRYANLHGGNRNMDMDIDTSMTEYDHGDATMFQD